MNRNHLLAVLALAACSGGTNIATDHNHAGSGTSTLLITADVNASMTDAGPVTSFQVDLRDGLDNRVSGATVIINNKDLGDVTLVEATAGTGRYLNSKASFPNGDFALAVSRGTDKVVGVVVGSPGAHTINAPVRSSVVPANQALVLSWTTPITAKSVAIDTKDFSAQAPDTGTYTIAAGDNPARAVQRLTIARQNEVEIAGGLSGSRLSVTFTSTVDPYTVQ